MSDIVERLRWEALESSKNPKLKRKVIKEAAAEILQLRAQVEDAKAYVDRAIASFVGDPADNRFLEGYLAALEVVRDEAFSSAIPSTVSDRSAK